MTKMPELTSKLKIKKPKGNEKVSRAVLNENYDIIDSAVASQEQLNEPFYLMSAVYSSGTGKIDCTFGKGTITFMDTIVSKDVSVYSIGSPSIHTSYYIYINTTGEFFHSTEKIEVPGAVPIWKVSVGAALTSITKEDLRGKLSGSDARVVQDNLNSLGSEVDNLSLSIGSLSTQINTLQSELNDISTEVDSRQILLKYPGKKSWTIKHSSSGNELIIAPSTSINGIDINTSNMIEIGGDGPSLKIGGVAINPDLYSVAGTSTLLLAADTERAASYTKSFRVVYGGTYTVYFEVQANTSVYNSSYGSAYAYVSVTGGGTFRTSSSSYVGSLMNCTVSAGATIKVSFGTYAGPYSRVWSAYIRNVRLYSGGFVPVTSYQWEVISN
jgi:hypothetical protein